MRSLLKRECTPQGSIELNSGVFRLNPSNLITFFPHSSSCKGLIIELVACKSVAFIFIVNVI